MAKPKSASIVRLKQPAMTGAERTRRYRERLKEKETAGPQNDPAALLHHQEPSGASLRSSTELQHDSRDVSIASQIVTVTAFALAVVGIVMNGWFARSLGSSEIAGWLFLAIGIAADCVALAMPSCGARLWAGQRLTSLAAWAVFAMTFVFAITAGIGFASVNISDVTMARASRVTPAVTAAQAALADAMAARDRECHGGVGKFCREREAAVADRRQAVDVAMKAVAETGDPQAQAATHLVAWLSHGMVTPTGDDFAMLRLVLLAVLPQIGGIILMIGRTKHDGSPGAIEGRR